MQANAMVTLPLHVYLELCGQHSSSSCCCNFVQEADDEFLMYTYKIRKCPKNRTHDWTECPLAHRGEKARRRDPRKFPYQGIVCPDFKDSGECKKGQNCELAHGVFEYWLHPTRFRTRVCESGVFCPRKVCFFAHTPEQLRPDGFPQRFRSEHQKQSSGTDLEKATTVPVVGPTASPCSSSSPPSTVKEVVDEEYCDFPHLEWVADLVN